MSELPVDWKLLEATVLDVKSEFLRATRKFGPFNTAHEGYSVILEELDELWDEIKGAHRTWAMRQEAVQICAMALRFIHDITPILGPLPNQDATKP